jgi:dipeptidase
VNVRAGSCVGLLLAAALLLGALAAPVQACTTVIVGKAATATGEVLIGHNEDLGTNDCQVYKVFPAVTYAPGSVYALYYGGSVPEPLLTQAYIATSVYNKTHQIGDITGTLNEHQVAIANNLADGRGGAQTGGSTILWSEFNQLAAQEATSAREAVRYIGSLVESHGLGLDSGTMYGIADPNEGWFMEIEGNQWVARRVPDAGAAMIANSFRIGVVDFNDPADFMWSPNVVTYAKSRGWYDPATDGPFDWYEAYAVPGSASLPGNQIRQDMVQQRLAAIVPHATKQDMMSILRWHYEGTQYDESNGYKSSPHHMSGVRTVCRTATEVSIVGELRNWLPAEIGGVLWVSEKTPCSSVYVPWYFGTSRIPKPYTVGTSTSTPGSAYWAFAHWVSKVDASYGSRIGPSKSAFGAFEQAEFDQQAAVETAALQLYATSHTAASEYLTDYCGARGLDAITKVLALSGDPDTFAPYTRQSGGGPDWRRSAVTVTLTSKDVGPSGVSRTESSLDGGAWKTGASVVVPAAADHSNDGVHTLSYRAADKAGNVEAPTPSVQVKIDTASPRTTDNADGLPHSLFVLVLKPADATSGVASTLFRIDGGPWLSGTSGTLRLAVRHRRAGYARGAHLVEYRSTDNAGNVEAIKSCIVTLGS